MLRGAAVVSRLGDGWRSGKSGREICYTELRKQLATAETTTRAVDVAGVVVELRKGSSRGSCRSEPYLEAGVVEWSVHRSTLGVYVADWDEGIALEKTEFPVPA